MTKIIDGRKAGITDKGRRYSTYREFAEKHGYPEAAAPSDSRDFREKLENGDIVTLLTSGPHLTGYPGATLWVVESANGERHVINEVGLRIMPAEVASITLLPDESLGGVLREYREVKRKANVGERIKIVASVRPNYPIGEVGVCTRNNQFSDGSIDTTLRFEGSMSDGFINTEVAEYVVLEPTDILRIDSERFRLVDRKAAVGERIILTKKNANFPHEPYVLGGVYVVEDAEDFGHINVTDRASFGISVGHYAILEPVESAAPTPEPALLSAQTVESQAAANIASLALRLTQAEAKITALESVVGALTERKVASGPVDTALPTFASLSVMKSAQQIRDEIVERAKADVSDLRKFSGKKIPNDFVSFWPKTDLPHAYIALHTVDFVVNSAKRTVVAIIRCTCDGLTTRGIAKCAPGETFNSALGKAIALYRALGVAVPAEYLNAPGPTEVRVGDYVQTYGSLRFKVTGSADLVTRQLANGVAQVLDDSRTSVAEDGGNSAVSSALKGAA